VTGGSTAEYLETVGLMAATSAGCGTAAIDARRFMARRSVVGEFVPHSRDSWCKHETGASISLLPPCVDLRDCTVWQDTLQTAPTRRSG
jgi:hypothetical protein